MHLYAAFVCICTNADYMQNKNMQKYVKMRTKYANICKNMDLPSYKCKI